MFYTICCGREVNERLKWYNTFVQYDDETPVPKPK